MGSLEWLSGERLTFADLAAAAHLSIIDYLGQISWSEGNPTKGWYTRMKCRPSFQTFLGESFPGLPPATHYPDLDF